MDNQFIFNEIQTQLSEESLKYLDKEVISELRDVVDSITLIKNMVSPYRKRAKDLKRYKRGDKSKLLYNRKTPIEDSEGVIIPSLENPHILENSDYFRQPAIHHQKFGTFTHLYPNRNPNSEYAKYWEEEKRRCIEGLVRPEDGEWIPGYFYFYLNYSPILMTEEIDEEDKLQSLGNNAADRDLDFPRFWDGDYLYFHYIEKGEAMGLYGNVLKTRGRGFSFKGGSMDARNAIHIKNSKSYSMAFEKEYLTKDGILVKAFDNLDWLAENTPWPRLRLINREMHKQIGYVDPELGIKKGMKSEIIGVSLKDDPDKARGKRGKLIKWEESGVFPGLKKAWGVARMSLEAGRVVFGYMVAFGTGGTEGADFEAAEEFFYNPTGYRILPMKNVFDKNKEHAICSFFFPEYLNRENCYDSNGNSDIVKALIEVFEDRLIVKRGTSDPHALTQEKADRPITPQEAVMRTEGSFFPVADLRDYLEDVMPNLREFVTPHYIGRLGYDLYTGGIKYEPDADLQPLRKWGLRPRDSKEGAIEIFEMPKRINGEVPRFRYIGGIDPYDDDSSTTSSLGSCFIFDMVTDRIVAEYTGRPKTAVEFYENCARLLGFYNAVANYENDKKGLFAYFNQKNLLYRLCDTPEILKDMDYIKGINLYGNKAKGTNSGKMVNAWGRRLQADWMNQLAYGGVEYTEDGTEITRTLLNLHKIRSLGYVDEAIHWNPDGNFDRISAMGMCMILREQYKKYIYQVEDITKSSGLGEDPFFSNNYDTHVLGLEKMLAQTAEGEREIQFKTIGNTRIIVQR